MVCMDEGARRHGFCTVAECIDYAFGACVCATSPIQRAYWGFGMVAYLVKCVVSVLCQRYICFVIYISLPNSPKFPLNCSRPGARRLLGTSANGMRGPIDGHVWYPNTIYATATDYITHHACETGNCRSSVRSWLNGDFPDMAYPD